MTRQQLILLAILATCAVATASAEDPADAHKAFVSALRSKVKPAAVVIEPGPDEPRIDARPGIVIDAKGIIITNVQAVAGRKTVKVRFDDGGMRDSAAIFPDPESGLTIIKLKMDKKLPSADFANSNNVEVGHVVGTVGSLFGEFGVTMGIVSGKAVGNDETQESFRVDASIGPGSSGSGIVVNAKGQIVGIVVGETQGVANILPSNRAKRIAARLLEMN